MKEYLGKNVLVVGGLGFIGSNLVHNLIKFGSNVVIADCLLPGHGGNLHNISGLEKLVEVHFTDIRDELGIKQLVKNKDIVFNIAAHSSHLDSVSNPLYDLDINCRGSLNLLEAVRESGNNSKVVYVGTRAQYGKTNGKVDENHPMNPLEFYAAHKMLAERYHLIYHDLFGMRVTCLRVNNTYGPRSQMKHSRFGVLNWFIRQAMEGEEIVIYGDGSQIRDYNYISDVVDALMLAGIEDGMNGQVYNLGSEDPRTFLELVKMIIDRVGKGSYKHVDFPDSRKKIDVGDFIADISKIKSFGWSPKISYEQGLDMTIDFYKSNKEYYW